MCNHHCHIADGKRGICGVRESRGGALYSLFYDKIVSPSLPFSLSSLTTRLYSPRNPTAKDFYRLAEDHSENIEAIYPKKYKWVLVNKMHDPPSIPMARFIYDRKSQVVYYRTDEKPLSFDPVKFLACLSVHVPNDREQTMLYME